MTHSSPEGVTGIMARPLKSASTPRRNRRSRRCSDRRRTLRVAAAARCRSGVMKGRSRVAACAAQLSRPHADWSSAGVALPRFTMAVSCVPISSSFPFGMRISMAAVSNSTPMNCFCSAAGPAFARLSSCFTRPVSPHTWSNARSAVASSPSYDRTAMSSTYASAGKPAAVRARATAAVILHSGWPAVRWPLIATTYQYSSPRHWMPSCHQSSGRMGQLL